MQALVVAFFCLACTSIARRARATIKHPQGSQNEELESLRSRSLGGMANELFREPTKRVAEESDGLSNTNVLTTLLWNVNPMSNSRASLQAPRIQPTHTRFHMQLDDDEELDASDTVSSWDEQLQEMRAWEEAQKKGKPHRRLGLEDEKDLGQLRQLAEKQASIMLSQIGSSAVVHGSADAAPGNAIATSLESMLAAINRLSDKIDAIDAKVDKLQSAQDRQKVGDIATVPFSGSTTVKSNSAGNWDGQVDEQAYFDDNEDDMPDWRDVRRLKKETLDLAASLQNKETDAIEKVDKLQAAQKSNSAPVETTSASMATKSDSAAEWDGHVDGQAYFDDDGDYLGDDMPDWRDVRRLNKLLEASKSPKPDAESVEGVEDATIDKQQAAQKTISDTTIIPASKSSDVKINSADNWDGQVDEEAYFDDNEDDMPDWRDVRRLKKLLEASKTHEPGGESGEDTKDE